MPTDSGNAYTSSSREDTPTCIVVDAEAIHLTDTDGADILIQVEEELQAQGTSLVLARVHPPVLALWDTCRSDHAVGKDGVFATVRDAVEALSDDRPEARRKPAKGAQQ